MQLQSNIKRHKIASLLTEKFTMKTNELAYVWSAKIVMVIWKTLKWLSQGPAIELDSHMKWSQDES